MKKLNKTCIAFFSILAAIFSNLSSEEEISLPDVTTVVSGNEVQVGKDALPDFSDIVSNENTASSPLIQMPEFTENVQEEPKIQPVAPSLSEKDLFVEGKIGGGYPGFFTGNFSVYQQKKENPFLLRFSHESVAGYSDESASDGYFDNETEVYGEKNFTLDDISWNFSGAYNRRSDGTQEQSSNFYDVTKQSVNGKVSVAFYFSDNLMFLLEAGGGYYNRYGGLKNSASIEKFEKDAYILDFTPSVSAVWSFDKMEISLCADYFQQNNIGDDEYLSATILDSQATFRSSVGASFRWSYQPFTIYESVKAVFGNQLGDDRNIIIPFTVGADVQASPSFLSGPFVFSIKGGLDSYQQTYRELEKKYHFAVLGFFPEETTDWYVVSNLSLPVHEKIGIAGNLEYRKTALDNCWWAANYKTPLASSLYSFAGYEREMLKSKAELTYHSGIFTAAASWTKNWKDIPVLEAENAFAFTLAVQSEDSKYGADLSAAFECGDESDTDPVLDLSGYVYATKSLRIALEVQDVVKLAAREKREYAGKFYSRGGTAAVLVKFFF